MKNYLIILLLFLSVGFSQQKKTDEPNPNKGIKIETKLEYKYEEKFGPVWTMRYDTVLVSVGYFDNSYNFINQSIEIVLD